jgi:undecaprenyl-diphosphatase
MAEALLHIDLADGYWKMYAIVIQLGAILCVPIYFRGALARMVATYPKGARRDRGLLTHPLGLTAVAFVLTAAPAFLLTKLIGHNLESLWVIGLSLLIGGVVMWLIDANERARTTDLERVSLAQAAWIGVCQIFSAVFPGTSRSMSTISGGQLAGLSRDAALEFSFFLAIPTMVVATGYDLLKSVRGGENAVGVSQIDAHGWIVLAIGFLVSFLVAYATVDWLIAFVRRRGLVPFAIYRMVVGALVLLFLVR